MIINSKQVTNSMFQKKGCKVFQIHVVIDDINSRVKKMIETITDESWIGKLKAGDQMCYGARAEPTIKKLVNQIFEKVDNVVSEDFGEYLISMTAQDALETAYNHKRLPLAELFKEKMTGNPGFDFHTESNTYLIAFGEAKYKSNATPYKNALTQINKFITLKKDVMELSDLEKLVDKKSYTNALKNKKAYIAAFSINAKNPLTIFENILKSDDIVPLCDFPELYLIGVEIVDTGLN